MKRREYLYPTGATPGTLTYEDYCALPDDGLRYEIIEGLLFGEPSPSPAHQGVAGNLYMMLRQHVDERGVVPDLIFVARERLHIVTERAVEGAPDLLVEIISPGSVRRDRVAKLNTYAKHGVRHCWLLDPAARTLEAFELAEGSYRLAAAVGDDETFRPTLFPDLVIPLPELWR